MALGDILNAAKALNLTDDQKDMVKKVVKEASGNKKTIAAELQKKGIPVGEDQIDMVIKLVEKL